ncbi:hypothetical protein ACH5RR_004887 [Cinchona calisaya]|uniref:Protein kinase domain-containing protein n=1 Tax=Cinchona calisaya TaxID=153742 RepID=A0ABD3AZ05_9GENT
MIHRDVKASNILLDSDLNGRVGDFGLARLYDHGTLPQTNHVVGTIGYLAPEHSRTGKATTSTDAVDQNLGADYVKEEAELVLKLGLFCYHSEPNVRPSMRQVLLYLEGSVPLPELPSLSISAVDLGFTQSGGFDDVNLSFSLSYKGCSHSISRIVRCRR